MLAFFPPSAMLFFSRILFPSNFFKLLLNMSIVDAEFVIDNSKISCHRFLCYFWLLLIVAHSVLYFVCYSFISFIFSIKTNFPPLLLIYIFCFYYPPFMSQLLQVHTCLFLCNLFINILSIYI